MASLSHTRSGITDGMVTCNSVDILCELLYSSDEQIKFGSAVTLGYLTFNRTASRILLYNCRNDPNIFDMLTKLISNENKVSPQFVESYHTAVALGLPKVLINNPTKSYENKKKSEENLKQFKAQSKRTSECTPYLQ